MVSVHVMAMRCAQHLATADDLGARAPRGPGPAARTFPAQIKALEPLPQPRRVQNVSVSDGGNAIVGNVTQHASVIVKDKGEAAAARKDAGSRHLLPA